MSNTTRSLPEESSDVVARSHRKILYELDSRRGWMWSGRVMRCAAVVAAATVLTSIGILGVASAAPSDVSMVSAASISERGFPGCPKLSEGDESDCVKQLQHALNTVNSAYNLKEDRKFGPDTRIAVLDFQGRNHLGADGIVGATTADELARQAQQNASVAAPRSTPIPQNDTPPSAKTGAARYRVELKAWIPHAVLYETPPGADICQPWLLGTKMWYEGDNHIGYGGGYRVLASYDFIWDGNNISDLSVDGAYGTTKLYMAGPLPNMQCENTGHATKSTNVSADGNTFTLSLSSANPLQHLAPPINSKLTATMISGDEMRVKIQTDKFPSHGFAVYKNGAPIATVVEFDASCVPNTGFRAAALIGNRLESFEHKAEHDIDLRVPDQQFFGPCGKERPKSLSYPAS
jgi:peptidoglycan hydrolase-like protein with peptidoglycan-binding domain